LKRTILYPVILIGAVALSGCSTWQKLDQQERGAVIGGGSGAVLGNVVSPGLGGGAAGAVAGGVIGHQMDEDDDS